MTGCDLPAATLTLKRERLKLRVGALRGRPLAARAAQAPARNGGSKRASVARADGSGCAACAAAR